MCQCRYQSQLYVAVDAYKGRRRKKCHGEAPLPRGESIRDDATRVCEGRRPKGAGEKTQDDECPDILCTRCTGIKCCESTECCEIEYLPPELTHLRALRQHTY